MTTTPDRRPSIKTSKKFSPTKHVPSVCFRAPTSLSSHPCNERGKYSLCRLLVCWWWLWANSSRKFQSCRQIKLASHESKTIANSSCCWSLVWQQKLSPVHRHPVSESRPWLAGSFVIVKLFCRFFLLLDLAQLAISNLCSRNPKPSDSYPLSLWLWKQKMPCPIFQCGVAVCQSPIKHCRSNFTMSFPLSFNGCWWNGNNRR